MVLAAAPLHAEEPTYPWHDGPDKANRLANRIDVPRGYRRVAAKAGSFAQWLRNLPLLKGRPKVLLHDGRAKPRQDVHAAVVDIDVGRRDLQQCADAVIRLRAEYLYSRERFDDIHFNFTSGDRADWSAWARGMRPVVRGSRVTWRHKARADASHGSFRTYLDTVFTYAGTASLEKELKRVKSTEDIRPGDVFIRGGFPGHAVLVVDVAEHARTGKRILLLAQSYMPAQQIHVLVNPGDAELSPWYPADFGKTLKTPEWTFEADQLRRFEND